MIDYQFGLLGHPITQSLSPAIHRAALEITNLSGSYVCYSITPGEQALSKIQELLHCLKEGKIHGLNVTQPYKRLILRCLDEQSETAQSLGAVNTLSFKHNRLYGDNTDLQGFLNDIHRIGFDFPKNTQKRALVIGAGGAARAVVYGLLRQSWQVYVVARRQMQSTELVEAFTGVSSQIYTLPMQPAAFLHNYHLIVNATPLGSAPHENASPWPAGLPFPEGAVLYDLNYHETPLIRLAREAKIPAAGGLGMLIEQAALSFEIWTGQTLPREALWQKLKNTIPEVQNLGAKGSTPR